VEGGALGLVTSQGDFTNGLRFVRQARAVLDETYKLPVGKRSTYLSRANELTLTFSKDGARRRRGPARLRRRDRVPIFPSRQG
jgi:hypothetical protein